MSAIMMQGKSTDPLWMLFAESRPIKAPPYYVVRNRPATAFERTGMSSSFSDLSFFDESIIDDEFDFDNEFDPLKDTGPDPENDDYEESVDYIGAPELARQRPTPADVVDIRSAEVRIADLFTSLGVYKRRYPDQTTLRIRYSLLNLDLTDDLLNIPLYLIDQTPLLIELALAAQY
jgi:hypothetical protein